MNYNKKKFLPNTILTVLKILEKNNVFFWLDAGSLLKGFRDKTILKSSDLDIATNSENTRNILSALAELSTIGYNYNFNGGYPLLEDLVTIYLPKKANKIKHIDIYIYHKSNKSYFRRSYHKPLSSSISRYLFYLSKKIMNLRKYKITSMDYNFEQYSNFYLLQNLARLIFYVYELFGITTWYVIPRKHFRKFKKIYLNGKKFNIPIKTAEYLKFRYGKDWNIPIVRSSWFESWKNNSKGILRKKKLKTNFDVKKNRYWVKFY
jgi:hypothetical protein